MKQIIILTMLLAFVAASFGQQITPNQNWTETDYYKKSKKQKTTAWVLLGSGVAGQRGDAQRKEEATHQLNSHCAAPAPRTRARRPGFRLRTLRASRV